MSAKPVKKPSYSATESEVFAAVEELAGDPRFQRFAELVYDMRENAAIRLQSDDVMSSHAVLAGYAGEMRAYTEILNRIDEAIRRRTDNVPVPNDYP